MVRYTAMAAVTRPGLRLCLFPLLNPAPFADIPKEELDPIADVSLARPGSSALDDKRQARGSGRLQPQAKEALPRRRLSAVLPRQRRPMR